MIRHYVYHEQVVHPCGSWRDTDRYPGGYFYSPNDDPNFQWGKLEPHEDTGEWRPLPIEQVPKEFRLQLLLLGVPM